MWIKKDQQVLLKSAEYQTLTQILPVDSIISTISSKKVLYFVSSQTC